MICLFLYVNLFVGHWDDEQKTPDFEDRRRMLIKVIIGHAAVLASMVVYGIWSFNP